MFQNKPRDKCHHFVYRWTKPCILFSGSFRNIYNTIYCLFLTLLILPSILGYALAADSDRLLDDDSEKPWHLVADQINYDDKAGYYIGKGNILITKGDKKLTADFVRFDQKTMRVYAKGHVIMTAGEDTLTGTSIEMNLESETGTVYNGTIFIKENHFYIKGDKIQKIGKDSYTVDKASITTCDSDKPAWKITGRNLKVTIEGYGFVKHATLWTKKVPVLYTPFLVFPVKSQRQSGLLAPQIGYSDRKGVEFNQPFYWAINENSDATFYLHYMTERGEKLGLEYRYVLDQSSKGTLMFDFLDDKKVDDGTESSKDWAFEDVTGSRPNADRYWFRMKHDQSMPFDFSLKLDVDFVSDQDYLHEFQGGYTGFDSTDRYFYEYFGRDLDGYDDYTRVNRLNLNRRWSKYALNAETRWYDNVVMRRKKLSNPTLQKLPIIGFDGLKQHIFASPLYFDLNSHYAYLYREDGDKGHRVDVYPRLLLPLRLKNYLSFETTLGMRETAWQIDEEEGTSSEKDWKLHREIYDIALDLSTEISKIYNLKGKNIDKMRHSIRPQIIYYYIPDDQDISLYPSFERRIDRINKKSLLVYSITNSLISRSKIYTKKPAKPIEDNDYIPANYTYEEPFRLKLRQSYDFNKAKEDDPEPFSPIYGDLRLTLVKYFSMNADAKWSHYEDDFLSHNVAALISDNRGDRLYVAHRYRRDSSESKKDGKESIYFNLLLKITDRLLLYMDHERNIYDKKDITTVLGLLYKAQCWSIDFRSAHEENDSRYTFMVNLYGLGGFGTEIVGQSSEEY